MSITTRLAKGSPLTFSEMDNNFLTLAGLINAGFNYSLDIGTVNNIAITLLAPPASYFDGMNFSAKILNTTTGPSTFNVNGFGPKNIYDQDGVLLVGGTLVAGQIYTFVYNSSLNSGIGGFNAFIPNSVNIPTAITTNNTGTTVGAQLASLGSTTGTTNVGYTPPGTGAVATTATARLSVRRSVFDFMTLVQIADVQAGTLTQDVTVSIQTAITACAGGSLYFPPGKYKITAAINIINALKLFCDFGMVTIVPATQNQNCFVVGNGTSGGQTTSKATTIDGFSFNPFPGVTAFTSGSCIFLNYCFYVRVFNCFFYGNDSGTNRLYTGVTLFQATECWVTHSYFYYLLGYGIYGSGTSVSLRTVDCRLDYNEFASFMGLDCIHLDANSAGCTINFPTMYSYWNGLTGGSANWGINLNGGVNGSLHYISQCDIEADGQSGGIYCQSGSNIDIDGGWIGTSTFNGVNPSLWCGASCNSMKVTGMQLLFGRVQIDGAACTMTGCDVVGDGVASTMGIIISNTATDFSMTGGTVRQHVLGGIQFSSTPPATRCKIVGVNFKSVGAVAGTGFEVVGSTGAVGSILGVSGNPSNLPPVIRDCQSDVAYTYAAGAGGNILLSVGRDFYQVTASANITTMTNLSLGNRIAIQAGAGGITFATGGNIVVVGSPLAVAAFKVINFVTDGQNWYACGQDF